MFIKDARDMVNILKDIVNAPTINIMLILGFLILVFSFIRFSNIEGFTLTFSPNWILFTIGFLLLLGSSIVFIFTRQDRKINRRIRIEDGLSLTFGKISVNLRVGEIQKISNPSQSSAVILPSNTTFIDDCITDKNSALGAFFLEHCPEKISDIKSVIEEQLKLAVYQKCENGTYPPGTTIIMPSPYNTPNKILITASTVRKETIGIKAEPSTICECVRQILMVTADKKISNLYMPVLGSGHGGLDINDAILFLLLSIKQYSKYYHHINSIDIKVTKNDASKVNNINRLQYLELLEGAKK